MFHSRGFVAFVVNGEWIDQAVEPLVLNRIPGVGIVSTT